MEDALSCDEIWRGELKLWQPREGYRFGIDPLLLIDFVHAIDARRICDLGSGCGVIALGCAKEHPTATVTAVELQPRLAGLARRNAEENGLGSRVSVVEIDLADEAACKRSLGGASFELVVSNPPYRPLGLGDANASEEAAIARHELRVKLSDIVRESRRILIPNGRAAYIYPADRLGEVLTALAAAQLQPVRLRAVHARAHDPANHVLVEARKGASSPLVILPPLVLYQGSEYSAEARRILGEDTATL